MDFSGVLQLFSHAFVDWLKIFIAPASKPDMLWIIVPIWVAWVFSEFFQEKKGTSFGNAITNGAVMLFVGIDWIRFIARQVSEGGLLSQGYIAEIVISAFVILASIAIIVLGIRGKKVVKYIGRARESTYLLLMFTPMIYGVVGFSLRIVAVVLAFFPLFYLFVELLDRVLPTPKTYELEEQEQADSAFFGTKDSGIDLNAGFSQPSQQGFQQRQPYWSPKL